MEPIMRMEPIGSLWSRAWKMYTERFNLVMGILLPPMLLVGLGGIFKATGFAPIMAAGSLLSFIGAIFSIAASAALIYALKNHVEFGDAYRAGWKLFWPLIWISILVALTSMGATVMFVIPGAWIAMMLVFANYTAVLEGKRGMGALLQSYAYVKGYWWSVFGRMFLLGIALAAAYVVLDVPFALIGGSVGRAIGSAIVILFFTPFSIVYHFSMFENLVSLKPAVRDSAPVEGKTFMRIAQIIGIIAIPLIIILVALGATGHLNGLLGNSAASGLYGGH